MRTLDIPLRGVFFRTNHQKLFIAVGSGAENSTCRTCRSVRTVGEKDVRVSPTYSPRMQPHRELRESNDTSAHTHTPTHTTHTPAVRRCATDTSNGSDSPVRGGSYRGMQKATSANICCGFPLPFGNHATPQLRLLPCPLQHTSARMRASNIASESHSHCAITPQQLQ